MSKYNSIKTVVDGVTFDSKAEARRFSALRLLERAGQISDLKRQVALVLIPGVKLYGASRARPAIRLVVDFEYRVNGTRVLEDTKGMETPTSLIKRHLAKAMLGLDVRITR